MANSRKKKNHIQSLQSKNGVAFSQANKHKVIFNHFLHHMGSYNPRSCSLNWSNLDWKPSNLQHLELPVTEEELKQIILSSPKEKAPGLDRFIGLFFSSCWDIIHGDLVRAVDHFSLSQPTRITSAQSSIYSAHPKEEVPTKSGGL
jgi:hypothetical protein